MLYESFGQLGRLREGTWLRKSVPKLQEIDFQKNFHEIGIFEKYDFLMATLDARQLFTHPTD